MELQDFLVQTQNDVQAEVSERSSYTYAQTVFAERVMQHLHEIGMTHELQPCQYATQVGNSKVGISGYAISEDCEELDLVVTLYFGDRTITPISDKETQTAANECLNFVKRCIDGKLSRLIDPSNDVIGLVKIIEESYSSIEQIRIMVLTDRQAKSKSFRPVELRGKQIRLDVFDIERLYNHWERGKPRDEIVFDFRQLVGRLLPCVYVPDNQEGYSYALTAIPGEALRAVYERYGARLLEANVRSFLSTSGKVNQGIRDTLREQPAHFMAYNNGIVLIADEAAFDKAEDESVGIARLTGVQIVNGGQTTASIYFTKKKDPDTDLSKVRVPAKIIILGESARSEDEIETLISDISRFSNTQNAIKHSDLSANKPFHVELENLSEKVYCPDGVGRWFYERAAGSYKTMLERKGDTPAQKKRLREVIVPPARKIGKTELAKFLNTWDQKPHLVSLGLQKNFDRFMESIEQSPLQLNESVYKKMIAKAIIFKCTSRIVRSKAKAFQANITAYTVALLANRLGGRFNLDRVWLAQDISPGLAKLLETWAVQVEQVLHSTANGKMVSEWAKKEACWVQVREAQYADLDPVLNIPELK